MNIIIDLILAAIVVAGLVIGIVRGFIKTIAKPVKFVLAIVLAFTLASPISKALVEPLIKDPVANQMQDYILEKCDDITTDNIDEELPTVLKLTAGIFDVNLDDLPEETSSEDVIALIIDKLISPAIHVISTVLTFILLYFILSLLLSLLITILNSVFDSGVVGVVNKILGGTVSLAFALIVAWTFTSIFTYVINTPLIASTEWAQQFEGGFIYKLFNSLNPIDIILSF